MVLGGGIIYAFGAMVLAMVMRLTLWQALVQGVIPFIVIDLIKAFALLNLWFREREGSTPKRAEHTFY